MTPSRDYRVGDYVVQIRRPLWAEHHVTLESHNERPAIVYSASLADEKLPSHVRTAFYRDRVVYWHIYVKDGKIDFVRQTDREEWIMGAISKDSNWTDDMVRAAGEVLFDEVELDLHEPDKHRPESLTNDNFWDKVKQYARDKANGLI